MPNKSYLWGLLILAVVLTGSCVTGPMQINPVYATRSNRQVSGEISFGEVRHPAPKYVGTSSMGAVELPGPVAAFCAESLQQELEAYGFSIDENAPLEVNAEVLQADTVWRQQGRAGVFGSTFALRFVLRNREGEEVYRQIHRGSASHSQSYGGYPASASVVDALATAYERFLSDAKLQQVLVQNRSINLYGELASAGEQESAYENEIYRDYRTALQAVGPDLLAYMQNTKFDAVYAIFGFKNLDNRRNRLSVEIERELRGLLAKERFQVVTRDIDEIMEEQKLQLSGLFDENKRVEIGQLAGATHLITGSLYHYPSDGVITMRIELVEVETGLVGASFTTNLLATQNYVDMVTAQP